jgi:predicted transcriptional regulator of viral defense system
MAGSSHMQTLRSLVARRGVIRARDAAAAGVPWVYLRRMVDRGELVKTGRGVYAAPDHQGTEHVSLAEVARRYPNAVICLLSALRYHDLTTQSPFEVWVMVDRTARKPAMRHPTLRVVRASGAALREGVESYESDGTRILVTNMAKTVCDCFRYRSKVGTDVAVEALRDAWRARRVTMDQLHHYAKIDRVANVIRPYLESIV